MTSLSTRTAVLGYAIALCGIVPLYPWLSPVLRIVLPLCMAAGIWQDLTVTWRIRAWMMNVAIVPVFIFYALRFSLASPVQPVVSMLAIMLAVRLLGEKSVRHYLQILALALFCLASSSLFSLSSLFLVYLGLMLLLVPVMLVLLTFQAQNRPMHLSPQALGKITGVGLLMPLASLPLLTLFFPLLPRTQVPLWEFLNLKPAGRTGFTDRVDPGRTPSIGQSRQPVLRAELARQPQPQLYWRGTVFNRLEGERWVRDEDLPDERIVYRGTRVIQRIYPEPADLPVLFSLDAPVRVDLPRAQQSADDVFTAPPGAGKRRSYTAVSVTDGTLAIAEPPDPSFYLQLPPDVSPRILALARQMHDGAATDAGRLDLIENFFRNGNFSYSLQALATGKNALELFMFQQKKGHCEFFASAFGVIARGAGIPCRLVGGYLGGEYSELGKYYLVDEAMAHVWVEAYVAGQGWVRIDPSRYAANAGQFWREGRQTDPLLRLRLAIDSFNHTWNRSIINYDLERQFDLVRGAGKRLQRFDPGRYLKSSAASGILAAIIVVVVVAARPWRWRRWFPSREEVLLKRFRRALKRDRGIEFRPGEGVFEIARRAGNGRVGEFVDLYAGSVYRDRRLSREKAKRLKLLLKLGFRD